MDKQTNKEGRLLARPCRSVSDVAAILKEMYEDLKARPGGGAVSAMYVGYNFFERVELAKTAASRAEARNMEAYAADLDDGSEEIDACLVKVYDADNNLDEVTVTHCRGGKLYGWSNRLMRRVVVNPADIAFGDALKLAGEIDGWAEGGDEPHDEEQL